MPKKRSQNGETNDLVRDFITPDRRVTPASLVIDLGITRSQAEYAIRILRAEGHVTQVGERLVYTDRGPRHVIVWEGVRDRARRAPASDPAPLPSGTMSANVPMHVRALQSMGPLLTVFMPRSGGDACRPV